MFGSRGKVRASVSKSNSKNLALACAEPEPEPEPLQISSADDPLGREETNEISNEEESTAGDQKSDEIICGIVIVEGNEEEQLANQVNGEENNAANEIYADTAEGVPLRQAVDVSEPVSDGVAEANAVENEGKINEGVPEEDNEHMQDEFMNDDEEAWVEMKNSEMDAEHSINDNEGLSESDRTIMEEKLADNMQNEEASEVNAEERGTAADNEKTERKGEDASIADDTNSVTQKIDRARRKVLKKKVVKKKMVVRGNTAPMDESKLQSLVGDETSSKVDKGTEAGEEMKMSEVSAEENMNVVEGLYASEHGTAEEKLADNMQNDEANVVNAEETTGAPADNGKIASAGDDARTAADDKSITDKVPKRKVLKKKVIKKKTVLQDGVSLVDEAKLGTSLGDEISVKADKAGTNEDAKNEEEAVLGDNGKFELAGDNVDNIKVDTEKANAPKRTVLKKKVVRKKVAQGVVGASVNEAKAHVSIKNDGSGKTIEADKDNDLKNAEKLEVKPAVRVNKKRKRNRRKKVPEAQADIATAAGEQKPKATNNEAGSDKNKATDGKNATTQEAAKPENMVSCLNKRKNKKMVTEDTGKVVADGVNAPEPSQNKSSKRIDGMGMIFMCSSATKKDCYRYKVLGLPASKKDIVSKIYKGMRLFLFDIDLRMMYGIYKAAGPGGYNIEPKAFKSQFPSQVRFTVLNDCVPLAEEKFKHAIKDNYYTKNKFDCQLTSEQVKNLCKLFTETSKQANLKTAARTLIPAAPSSASQDRKRKRAEDSRHSRAVDTRNAGHIDSREARRIAPIELERSRRWAHEEVRRPHEEVRRPPIVIDDRYPHEREAYRPPSLPTTVYHLSPQHPPRTSSYSYDYEEASRVDIEVYRREPALGHRRLDLLPSSGDWERTVAAPRNLDPYIPYRETHAYREPVYETSVWREAAAYETPNVGPADYEYYRTAEYQAPLPPYRRY